MCSHATGRRPDPGATIESLRAELRAEIPSAPPGEALVVRYRANYAIPPALELTERMVLEHWKLERELTRRLLAAPPEERARSFREAYETLYRSLPWLNAGDDSPHPWEEVLVADFLNLLGPRPLRLLELGAGRGRVAARLAAAGHSVVAGDLAAERRPGWAGATTESASSERPADRRVEADTVAKAGFARAAEGPGSAGGPGETNGAREPGAGRLEWRVLDAVRPDRVEPAGSYDAVLSNQMIEHLHPDDLAAHFAAVLRLLRPGGKYLFTTPHAYFGPADLSRVFGATRPMGMHLREYTVGELRREALAAGFAKVEAGWRPPLRLARLLGVGPAGTAAAGCGTRPAGERARATGPAMRPSVAYRAWLEGCERLLSLVPAGPARRAGARALRLALFREVPLVATRVG